MNRRAIILATTLASACTWTHCCARPGTGDGGSAATRLAALFREHVPAIDRALRETHLLAPSHHGAPREGKTDFVVFSEFGGDVVARCTKAGFEVERLRDAVTPALVTFIAHRPSSPCRSPQNPRHRTTVDVPSSLDLRGWYRVLPCVPDINEVHNVRTNIEIDDKLMKDALKATGARTKRQAVELGLKTLVQLRAQEKARELKGKITWEGDLNAMRTDR